MFLINLQGKESIYEQIRNQITKFINLGVLKADDKLPSVRQLATELGINPNTVQKAYQELEMEGYIYTMPKKGAFVANRDIEVDDLIIQETRSLLVKLKDQGLTKTTIMKIVDEVYGGNKC